MPEPIIPKFGGTSMATPETVAEIVESRPDHELVVVSAPGKGPYTPERMTLMLRNYAGLVAAESPQVSSMRDDIVSVYDTLYSNMLGNDVLRELRQQVNLQLTPAGRDDKPYFESKGELFSSVYFARSIGATCIYPAIRFKGDGQIDRKKTQRAIQEQVRRNPGRKVAGGYFGEDEFGRVWLLNDGGSDRTQIIYSVVLGWDAENWTDVDGYFSTDPQLYKNTGEVDPTRLLSEVTREELREGAHGGSDVLQGDTMLDLNGSDVLVTIKNTKNIDSPGTRVVPHLSEKRDNPVVAISGRSDLVQIGVRDLGMADRKGYVAELLTFLAKQGLSFKHMPAAEDAFGLTLINEPDNKDVRIFEEFIRNHKLSEQGRVNVKEAGIVYVVGEGLRGSESNSFDREQVTGRALLTAANCRIHALPVVGSDVPGTTSPSIALLTDREHVIPLIKSLHRTEIETQ